MFDYRTLKNTSVEVIHEAFLMAFSDYQIKIDLPFSKFTQMLKRRGYEPKISVGAFKNDVLIGFVLNGLRDFEGKLTAYDVGTGVKREYRKQGVTSNILMRAEKMLKENKAQQYLLEVIQSNTSAIELYKKQGFDIKRTFECFELEKNSYNIIETHKVEHINQIDESDWRNIKSFWDYTPSWQNSIASINAAKDTLIYTVVRLEGQIVGYGIIDKNTGDIPQIAVCRSHRRKGIAKSIIADLYKRTKAAKVSVLNVDSQSIATKTFLKELGFEYVVGQYEMIKKHNMQKFMQ